MTPDKIACLHATFTELDALLVELLKELEAEDRVRHITNMRTWPDGEGCRTCPEKRNQQRVERGIPF